MKRFASTRSENRARQPGAGRAQCSVGSIEAEGDPVGVHPPRLHGEDDADRGDYRHDPVEGDAPGPWEARPGAPEHRLSYPLGSEKAAVAFAVRRAASPVSSSARVSASAVTVWTTFAGSFGRPRRGCGAGEGLSVSTGRRAG